MELPDQKISTSNFIFNSFCAATLEINSSGMFVSSVYKYFLSCLAIEFYLRYTFYVVFSVNG